MNDFWRSLLQLTAKSTAVVRNPMKKTMLLLLLVGVAALCTPVARAQLTCSPAPCVSPNISFSPQDTSTTVAGFALASDQTSSAVAITANYLENMSYCYGSAVNSSESGVFWATDLEQLFTFNGGCQPSSGADLGPNFDPMAAYDSEGNLFSGQLGYTSSAEGVFLQELPQGSSTWGGFFPTLAFTDLMTINFYDYDFPGMAIDNVANPSALYTTAFEFGLRRSNHELVSAVAVAHSTDDGATWATQRVSRIVSSPTEATYPRVTAAYDGTVLCTWIQNNRGNSPKVYAVTSTDFGSTWSTPGNVFSISQPFANTTCTSIFPLDRALPNTCVRMFYFPQLTTTYSSTSGQKFHAVYPNYNGTNVHIQYRNSTDGVTWSSPLIVSNVSADQFEPCIASQSQSSNTIGIAWLDTRNSPTGSPDTLYDAYAIVSLDGGSTFSSVYRLSSTSSSTSVETKPNAEYLGDWTGCAWSNDGTYFYFAYPNTTGGTNQVGTVVALSP